MATSPVPIIYSQRLIKGLKENLYIQYFGSDLELKTVKFF